MIINDEEENLKLVLLALEAETKKAGIEDDFERFGIPRQNTKTLDGREWKSWEANRNMPVVSPTKDSRPPYRAANLISQLPVELMLRIFEFLALDEKQFDSSSNRKPYAWIFEITHICSYWRDLALDHPILWSIPNFRNPACAIAMIQRNRGRPLTIQLQAKRPTSRLVRNEFSRIMGSRVERIWLRNLNFRWNRSFVEHFSKLSSLRIELLDEPWWWRAEERSQVSIITLLPLLSLLPHLAELYLGRVFFHLSRQDLMWSEANKVRVQMLNLKELTLVTSYNHGMVLIKHLSFPPWVRFQFSDTSTTTPPSTIDACVEMVRVLNTRIETLASPRCLAIFRNAETGRTSIGLWTEPHTYNDEYFRICTPPNVSLAGGFSLKTISSLLSIFHLAQIESLLLDTPFLDLPLWRSVARLPSLRNLIFRHIDFGFLDIRPRDRDWKMQDLVSFIEIADDDQSYFQSLSTICANGCKFPPCHSLCAHSPPASKSFIPREEYASCVNQRLQDQTFDRHRLLQFLEIRKDTGFEFDGLVLHYCTGLTNQVIEDFRKVVHTEIDQTLSHVYKDI